MIYIQLNNFYISSVLINYYYYYLYLKKSPGTIVEILVVYCGKLKSHRILYIVCVSEKKIKYLSFFHLVIVIII